MCSFMSLFQGDTLKPLPEFLLAAAGGHSQGLKVLPKAGEARGTTASSGLTGVTHAMALPSCSCSRVYFRETADLAVKKIKQPLMVIILMNYSSH